MTDPDSEVETTTTTTRRFTGLDATFGTDPDEIYIEVRAGRPSYIHVEVGHYLQEGDAFHRNQLGEATPAIETWEVVEISPDRVLGRDLDSDDVVEWDRETLEQRLAVGTYSTNLTDFERLSVHEVGGRTDESASPATGGYRYSGPPYVAVVAYGDNGLKYGRRYRFTDGDGRTVELWTEDLAVDRLSDEVAARLDRRVHEALEADGYSVVEPA